MTKPDNATPRPDLFDTEADEWSYRKALDYMTPQARALIVASVNAHDAHAALVEAAQAVMVDLDHYVSNHADGPDHRRDALRAALARVRESEGK